MPKYTLYYFEARGRAELIRLIFALAGVEYEDVRFPYPEWKKVKTDTKKYPFGQLPVLQVGDDVFIPQTFAIARYLANEFGLAGKTNLERAKCDVLLYACSDIYQVYYPKIMALSDADEKAKCQKEFIETTLKESLIKIEGYLVTIGHGNGFIVSDEPTFVDLLLIGLSDTFTEEAFNDFPVLKRFLAKIKAVPNIKAWLEKRPKTAM